MKLAIEKLLHTFLRYYKNILYIYTDYEMHL